jgi:hypothetical protein
MFTSKEKAQIRRAIENEQFMGQCSGKPTEEVGFKLGEDLEKIE